MCACPSAFGGRTVLLGMTNGSWFVAVGRKAKRIPSNVIPHDGGVRHRLSRPSPLVQRRDALSIITLKVKSTTISLTVNEGWVHKRGIQYPSALRADGRCGVMRRHQQIRATKKSPGRSPGRRRKSWRYLGGILEVIRSAFGVSSRERCLLVSLHGNWVPTCGADLSCSPVVPTRACAVPGSDPATGASRRAEWCPHPRNNTWWRDE
jgi:hypothetical protein